MKTFFCWHKNYLGLVTIGLALTVLTLAGCATSGTAVASPSVPKAIPQRYEAEAALIVNSTHKKDDAPIGTERQSFFSGKLAAGGLNKATKNSRCCRRLVEHRLCKIWRKSCCRR